MALVSDRVMFEIYRESGLNRKYRVVYYTELHDMNKEYEINRALGAAHVYDGFFRDSCNDDAKAEIAKLLNRLNDGEELAHDTIDEALSSFKPKDD